MHHGSKAWCFHCTPFAMDCAEVLAAGVRGLAVPTAPGEKNEGGILLRGLPKVHQYN